MIYEHGGAGKMGNSTAIMFFMLVSMALVLFCAIRKKWEWLLNVVMRSVLGAIAIYFINMGLGYVGFYPGIGVNAVTVLTSGILGFPGVLVLYGLWIYQLL